MPFVCFLFVWYMIDSWSKTVEQGMKGMFSICMYKIYVLRDLDIYKWPWVSFVLNSICLLLIFVIYVEVNILMDFDLSKPTIINRSLVPRNICDQWNVLVMAILISKLEKGISYVLNDLDRFKMPSETLAQKS